MKLTKYCAISTMLFSAGLHASDRYVYIVREGDTLSTIAQTQVGSPVYSQGGSLSKVLKLNPDIVDKNLVFPGQKVFLVRAYQVSSHNNSPNTSRDLTDQPGVLASKNSDERTENLDTPRSEVPHIFQLAPSLGITTLFGTDTTTGSKATLFSSHDLQVLAAWRQNWTESFFTKISAQLRSVDFQQTTSGSKKVSNSLKTIPTLSLSAGNHLTEKLSLVYSADFGGELFIRGLSTTDVTVDSAPIPKFNLGAEFQVYKIGKTSVNLDGKFAYLLGTSTDSYSIEDGNEYQLGLSVNRRYGLDRSAEIRIGYKGRTQNTSIVKIREESISGTLVFTLPIFEGDKK